jgi:CVNH domain
VRIKGTVTSYPTSEFGFNVVFVIAETNSSKNSMALATNSKNLRIDAWGRLSGETKQGDGSWATHSKIDVNEKLGNDDGQFMFVESMHTGFKIHNARDLKLEGTILRAQLKNCSGAFVEASIDLARVIKVMPVDGEFAFISKCVYSSLLHAVTDSGH